MITSFQTTAVIRQRGQITIPDKIRERISWLAPNSVVTVLTKKEEEIIIKPYTTEVTRKTDWGEIWEGIRLARSFTGKRGNLSKFIEEDRKRH